MSYGLEILRSAQKQLAQITQVDRDRIITAIEFLILVVTVGHRRDIYR